MGARRWMGKQYDGVRARAPNRIVDVDAAPRDARAREDDDDAR